MSNIDNILQSLFEDHIKFLNLMGDMASFSVSSLDWIKIRSYLSPAKKYQITDTIMMVPEIISKAKVIPVNHIIYKERGKIKIFVKYDFLVYETAACNEFFLRGAPLHSAQMMDIKGVTHELNISADDPNKIIGLLSIVKTENADIYDMLLDYYQTKSSK